MDETTSNGSGFPGWLRDIVDAGTGFFNRFADLELRRKELEIFGEANAAQNQQVAEQQARQDAFNGGGTIGGIDSTTLLMLGAGAIALIVLLRR